MGERSCFIHHHMLTASQRRDYKGSLGEGLFKREF